MTGILHSRFITLHLRLIDIRFGTYSNDLALQAGLDLEMPGPSVFCGKQIEALINCGKLTEDPINESVRRLLDLTARVNQVAVSYDNSRAKERAKEMSHLLRRIASDSIFLLKNDQNTLPLRPDKRVGFYNMNLVNGN